MKYTDIVLVDYSDCSASALKFAKNWSLNTGGELIIINQLDTSVPGLSSAESERSLRTERWRAVLFIAMVSADHVY